MAVNGELNALGQMRVDLPHLRMFDSGVRYDFDALAYMLVGGSPQILRGFELFSNPIGAEASLLTFNVAGSKVIHPLASESGSIFAVPSNRPSEVINPILNPRIQGSIQPQAINFVSIDLKRSADPTTSDIVQFLDPSQNTESPQKVPLRRTLDYVWIIEQTDFSFNRSVCPVAIVTTNNLNIITAFKDARPLMGRLTPGGTVSSEINPYGWPGGRPNTTLSSLSPVVGDKAFRSFKDIINGIETRLWELGGGEQWFSPTADRNVNLHIGASTFTSSGESFEVVSGNLHWKGLAFSYDNSPQFTTAIIDQPGDLIGLTDLASGECIYVDLDRTSSSTISAKKGQLSTLGIGNKPGSRWVIASRIGSNYYVNGQPFPIGSSFALATTGHAGVMKTNLDATSTLNPIAATMNTDVTTGYGVVTGAGISHNADVGSAHTLPSTSGAPDDIFIGRGTTAGDKNVVISTGGTSNGTTVFGQGDSNTPYLFVARGNGSGGPAPGTSGSSAGTTPLDLVSSRFEGTKSWALEAITVMPLAPNGGPGIPRPFIKYFSVQTKTWKSPVNWLADSIDTSSYFYDNSTKTLTANSVGALSIDSGSPLAGDRVLVNTVGQPANGIYVVTLAGNSSTAAVLTRSGDAGGPSSPTILGLGFDFWNGSAVSVTQGHVFTNTRFMVQTINKNNAVVLDGTVVTLWQATDAVTSDQLAVMFFDGSYTVIASGPAYNAA